MTVVSAQPAHISKTPVPTRALTQDEKERVNNKLDDSDDIQRDGKAHINNTITYNRV